MMDWVVWNTLVLQEMGQISHEEKMTKQAWVDLGQTQSNWNWDWVDQNWDNGLDWSNLEL